MNARRSISRRAAIASMLASIALAAGCSLIQPLTYFLRPPDIQKAQFEFPPGSRVLIMLDPARPEYDSPIFARALFDGVCDNFREKKSSVQFIPPREVAELRREHSDFQSWSVQRIGRELNADHVLWVKVDRYQTRQSPAYPVLEPYAELRVKVIAVDNPSTDARVWPTEKEGMKVTSSRPVREAADSSAEDLEAKRLARDAAWQIAFPFFEQNLEDPKPREG